MKKFFTMAVIATMGIAMLAFTGCEDRVKVTGLIDVPTTAIVGVPLQLTGTVQPSNASHGGIDWHFPWRQPDESFNYFGIRPNLPGTTLFGGVFLATQPGVEVVQAAVWCNWSSGAPVFTFTINVVDGVNTLILRNETFSEITDVVWHGVNFGSIGVGSIVERGVPAGSGFIHFERVTDPIVARTSAVVTVEPGARNEFVFLNTTIIVDQNIGETGRFDELGR